MEKEEIKVNKPSATLYVLLFIFYTIWILQAFGAISFHFTFGFDEFSEYGMREWLFIPLFCFGGILCLYSVIKVLRGDRDCITALKWALMYSFLYTFFNSARTQIPTYNLLAILAVYLSRPLFYLGFYLYLCFSKGIKRRYPKSERRFAPSGWVWVGVTVCLFGFAFWTGYDTYKTDEFCKRVNVQELSLEKGEISDGYVVFKSSLAWTPSNEPTDTIYIGDEKVFCEQTLEAVDSLSSFFLFSGRSEKRDARTHNQILTKLLAEFDQEIVEVAHRDTLLSDKYVISTAFESKSEATPIDLTVATVFDVNSPKCIVLLSKYQDIDNPEWLDEIICSLKWDLQNIPKTKHEKNRNNNKNDISSRTGKCYNKANSYVFGSFLKGCSPRFLFCEMLLEHHKRKIAYCQSYNPFYY